VRSKIEIGTYAGCRFESGRLEVARHAVRVYEDGTREKGFAVRAKWVYDKVGNQQNPVEGFAYEHWFEWKTGVLK
jgi:hypothetical protein